MLILHNSLNQESVYKNLTNKYSVAIPTSNYRRTDIIKLCQ